MNWKFADARNRFSELFRLALSEGPQRIQRRDRAVIVLDEAEYDRLTCKEGCFKDFLFHGPSLEGLDLKRDSTPMRNVDL